MKMISSTSITSTSGVTLISLIGGLRLPRPPELTDIPIRRRSVPAHGPKGRETRRKRRGGAFPAARPRGAAGYSRSPQEVRRTGRSRWRTAPRQCRGPPDRKRVVKGKRLSVRGDFGGRRSLEKKTQKN